MTRIAAITPAHRNYLRQLKTDFDQAYAEIDDLSDRTSPRFRAAEALYRVWIKSIDAHAMALLDDLDAFDEAEGVVGPNLSNASIFARGADRCRGSRPYLCRNGGRSARTGSH